MTLWLDKDTYNSLDKYLAANGIVTKHLVPDKVVEHEDKVIIPVIPSTREDFKFKDYTRWTSLNKEVDFVFLKYAFSCLELYPNVCLNSPGGDYIYFETIDDEDVIFNILKKYCTPERTTFEKLFELI